MVDQARLIERSKFLLENARFVTLATQGETGPWASTVNYVLLGSPVRLLWYSLREARHSLNLAADPRASGSLYLTGLPGLGLDGAQVTGIVREVGPDALPEHHRLYYELNFPDETVRQEWLLPITEFTGDGPRRFYVLEIDQWWLMDLDRWLEDKQDHRIEVPVGKLDA
ncbi:pyridoxamine 5'-phosphate oxidase family protein [Actinoallomurus purpureus]|uniref:pyridoxamine 5'-phosphate oxidase family protein n=1 Tax=Actinoallomurus purpureus TaxID=478114 RepID=UPI002092950E|nr:pyridoxamine 5'-phosphate oxidase family protein [Actinoallomurus purpureus]MCO6007908.1 pyridoxamine 5'-phosphate oxidase family protein [Actinoallomurus purpureus]